MGRKGLRFSSCPPSRVRREEPPAVNTCPLVPAPRGTSDCHVRLLVGAQPGHARFYSGSSFLPILSSMCKVSLFSYYKSNENSHFLSASGAELSALHCTVTKTATNTVTAVSRTLLTAGRGQDAQRPRRQSRRGFWSFLRDGDVTRLLGN